MRRLTGLVLAGAFLSSVVARAEEPAKPPPRVSSALPARAPVYTLRRCLELAEQNYPKVSEAKARLRNKEAQASQAYTAPYSEWTLSGGIGPAPTVRGTSVYSPNTDVALTSNMALAWQMGIDGVVPLWTFGKISNLWDAAEAQIKVGEHEVKKEKNDVKLSVRRAYYGVLLARDSLALVREAAKQIDKHLGRLEARVDAGEGDDIELLKLKMYRAELEARESEAQKQERIALAGLRFLTGVKGPFDVPDKPLTRVRHTLAPLGRYLDAARLFRPEVNMARAGVLARQAQVRLEQSRYFPDLGLGLSARYSRAPEVTNQTNPYVNDSANRFMYGAALALKWKLDFLPQSARVAQARAQLEEIRATERYALGGVGTEVEQSFAEATDAAKRVDAYTRAQGYARQWLIKVQQGIDVGTFDDEDIVSPAKEYALKRFSQMSAVYEYNIAIAKLSQATGWDAIAPVE
ncbi:MAG: TolC family protein [Myxococcales bacterium]|nr:TolC family protein [Myxococcales bacterium]